MQETKRPKKCPWAGMTSDRVRAAVLEIHGGAKWADVQARTGINSGTIGRARKRMEASGELPKRVAA